MIRQLQVQGVFMENTYFYIDEHSKAGFLIDPGAQAGLIYDAIAGNGWHIEKILLTHGHFDHIWGTNKLRELSGAPIYAYEEEKVLCEDAAVNMSARAGRAYTVVPDRYLKDGEEITIADMTCKLIATPGHTIGSCCYYFEDDGILVSGDTLFQESVGRTDLPTGSMGELTRSIREKLLILPDDVKVYPGHGDVTDIGHERMYNPFC